MEQGQIAEARAQLSGAAPQIAIDAMPHMVRLFCVDDHSVHHNRRWHEFTGLSRSAPGEAWLDLVHPDDREGALAAWKNALETGAACEFEHRLLHRSGAHRWVLCHASPIRGAQGRIEHWVGTYTDIHAWKEAEQTFAESEERYRALVEATASMVWRASPDGRILRGWGWKEFCGQEPEEYEGHGWLNVVHPEDYEAVTSVWCGALSSSQVAEKEFRVRHRSGDYRWVLSRAIPLKNADGAVREWVGTITDIHDQRRAQNTLRTSEERLRLAAETTSAGIWDLDLVTGSVEWTAEIWDILGLTPDVPAAIEHFFARVHPDDLADVRGKAFADVPGKGPQYNSMFRIVRADSGQVRWIESSVRMVLGDNGQPIRKVGMIQDVTQRKLSEDMLLATEERLRLAMQAGRMIAWEHDLDTGYVTRSVNSIELLGIDSGPLSEFLERVPPEDRLARDQFIEKISATGSDTMEFRYTLPSGKTLWLASRGERAGPNRVVGVTFDITDRKAAEEKVWRSANHDGLTGLPNRVLFQRYLEQALGEAKENGTSVSLLMIDLDDFKDVNDTLGHDAGDMLLKQTADRLSVMMREQDTVARLGGDEFAVLVVEPLRLSHAANLGEIILRRLRKPFTYAGRTLINRASIGVAAYPDHDSEPVELMKDADIALYRAKAEGRGRVVTYDPGMRLLTEHRLALGRDMREAISHDQFVPFYQPKICLSSGRIVGLEALARWQHKDKGILTPSVFEAVFDDPELAPAIGKRLIGKIASDMRRWLDGGCEFGRVAFNLSSVEFNQPNLADDVIRVFNLVKVPTDRFEVEVTEKVLLDGQFGLVSHILERFHEHDVRIALDDFGTGYASLIHLKRFPVDHIKIDRSFVADLEHDDDNAAIVAAVIGLGHSLGLHVTAEGVETEGQALRLRTMGCHSAQGYFYARPMPAAQMTELLAAWPVRVTSEASES
ncbi:sensor domain-containing protein [Microvirga makkahensis]|uniref:EAL domain-containing protein n=1 Tax=Microvirga makkahensis TaxID=1128670 RepID=A0A7X3MT52_9HYPH|nr:PAS domain-containing protein [Microvirga makkahensis]MXQ12762.1 EAL domain-containing protein [Microvirga makkahensis]